MDMLLTEVLDVQLFLSVEFALQLEVTMTDRLRLSSSPSILVECGHGDAHAQE